MSDFKFLVVNNLIYKCHIDTTIEGVEFKNEYKHNDSINSLLIYLKCPMSSLSMSQYDLLNMLFNDFIDIDECYKYTQDNNMLTEEDKSDIPIDLNFKHLLYSLHILPNGNDNCIVSLKDCFYDSNAFNIIEKKSDSDSDSVFDKVKATKPKKLTELEQLERLKKQLENNKDKIIECFETIDFLKEQNEELKNDIEEMQFKLLKMEMEELKK